jgi:zinc transport system substrate-binding protein
MLYHNITTDKEPPMRRALSLLLLLTTPAQAEPPQVLTDIPAIHSLTAQVTGALISPALLLSGTDDPHHTALRPSQARAITRSDLIIWAGPALTPWLASTLDKIAPDIVSLPLLADAGTTLRDNDPHAWLDPENATVWLDSIAKILAAEDPDNAATYQHNASIAQANLKSLTAQLSQTLAPAENKPIITAHNAYGYFADHFDLIIAATLSDSDDTPPSAARISKLRKLATTIDIACVFSQGPQNDALIVTLTENTAIPTATLDPTGVTIPSGPGLYATLLTNIANTIADCTAKAQP